MFTKDETDVICKCVFIIQVGFLSEKDYQRNCATCHFFFLFFLQKTKPLFGSNVKIKPESKGPALLIQMQQ